MRSLRINGFKIYALNTDCISDALIGYFAGGPQEKFCRIFTAMMFIDAYDTPYPIL